eukprot:GEZU01019255.1.p1 GENE.GEZU01019255.1~~GEZU01019255.1.p1  ORF type:complete len:388 (-),score=149.70 GEZU01019255.1:47-1210(-)
MLIADDLTLISTLPACRVDYIDSIVAPLTFLFEHHGKSISLMRFLIFQEVWAKKSAPATLFRANSIASKVVKQYMTVVGLEYLYNTISPSIKDVMAMQSSLQVLAHKLKEDDDVNANTWELMAVVQKIFVAITKSINTCPNQLRFLCFLLGKAVRDVFGEFDVARTSDYTSGAINAKPAAEGTRHKRSHTIMAAAAANAAGSSDASASASADNKIDPKSIAHNVISGIMFLRFFCAAVTTPQEYGIVSEQPSGDARERLINVSKVLTNLANQTRFGNKEPGLLRINEFIDTNLSVIKNFYDELMAEPANSNLEDDSASAFASVKLPEGTREASLAILHGFIVDNYEVIIKELEKRTDSEAAKVKSELQAIVNSTKRVDKKEREMTEV